MAADSMIDYFQQTITFESPNGPVNVTLSTINAEYQYNIQICINYGSQIGASIATLIVLILLSKPEKRLSSIMILNCCSLIFNIIRNVLQCLYFTGPFAELYAQFTGDFSRVGAKDLAISVTATVFTLLLQISVETSLYLQARVVCVTLRDIYKRVILVISAIVASLAIAFRFAYMVENDKDIVQQIGSTNILLLGHSTNISTSISIIWFSAIFVTKLGVALRQRKKMGLTQFGPMEILLIMGCQTLTIPASFSILQFFGFPAASSNALTACAVSLPLSSLWASATILNRSKNSRSTSSYLLGFSKGSAGYKPTTAPLSPTGTVTTNHGSVSQPLSPNKLGTQQIQEDLERQGLAGSEHSTTSKA